jgi:flagellar biosynthetic protein FliP
MRRGARLALAAAALMLAAAPAAAQSFNLDLGDEGGSLTGRIVQLLILFTVLSLAPSILVVLTSFTRIVVVLSLMRSALGIQQTPPNAVLISLALFLTAFVMAPTLESAYHDGIAPLIDEEIDEEEAFTRTVQPFRTFMLGQVREKDLALFVRMAQADIGPGEAQKAASDSLGVIGAAQAQDSAPPSEADPPEVTDPADAPLKALVPAFVISELRRAFEIAFLIFIPFLIIDMVVASVLMSMGMMMLPPVIISLPFKLIFFVLLDGWYLIAGSLVQSFGG